MNKNIKIVISCISIIAIFGVSSLIYDWYINEVNYEKLLKTADSYLDEGDYDKAKELYNESKNTKETAHVDNKLNLIENREEIAKGLKEAEELLDNNKIEDALNLLDSLPSIPEDFDKKLSTDLDKILNVTNNVLDKEHDTTVKIANGVDAFNNFSNELDKVTNETSSSINKLVELIKKHNHNNA